MSIEELEVEALEAWVEYGKAITEAFNFKKGSLINTEVIQEAVQKNDAERLKNLIQHAREQTRIIQSID